MSTNSKPSKSPERHTFQKEKYMERRAEEGLTPENDKEVKAMEEIYNSFNVREDEREADTEWQKDNLEWDLRTTDWILDKARARESYAQNIYAALCNNGFIKLAVIPILTEKEWSCSWRYAGGIVAHMRQEGDYIDWYCSGIRGGMTHNDEPEEPPKEPTEEYKQKLEELKRYVPEGKITDEIREDFQKLGWAVAPDGDWEKFE